MPLRLRYGIGPLWLRAQLTAHVCMSRHGGGQRCVGSSTMQHRCSKGFQAQGKFATLAASHQPPTRTSGRHSSASTRSSATARATAASALSCPRKSKCERSARPVPYLQFIVAHQGIRIAARDERTAST